MNYRRQNLLVLWRLSFLLTLLMLAAHLMYLSYGAFANRKMFLKEVCRGVRDVLAADCVVLSDGLKKETKCMLNRTLKFSGDPRMHCAILDNEGAELYRYGKFLGPFEIPVEFGQIPSSYVIKVPSDEEQRAFKIFSGSYPDPRDSFLDSLQTWRIMEFLAIPGGIVCVESTCHFELFERMLEGGGVSVLFSLVIVYMMRRFLERSIFRPFESVMECLQKIREGNLDVRISVPGTGNELDRLIVQLNETFGDLEAAFSRIRRFSSDAAHELRTPLTVMRGEMEVCLEATDGNLEEYQRTLSACIDEVASMSKMIEAILQLTKMERDVYPKSQQDLSALAQQAVGWAAELTELKRQRLEWDIGESVVMEAIPGTMEQVFRNLLSNAIKYTPEGGNIRLKLHGGGGTAVELSVEDTGIGIAPEFQARIFERFYRIDKSREDGHGLGLALVKHIVECHRGRITVESRLGEGTVFRIVFP